MALKSRLYVGNLELLHVSVKFIFSTKLNVFHIPCHLFHAYFNRGMNTTNDAVHNKWCLMSVTASPADTRINTLETAGHWPNPTSAPCRHCRSPTPQVWAELWASVVTAHAPRPGTGLIVGGWGLDRPRARAGVIRCWPGVSGCDQASHHPLVTGPGGGQEIRNIVTKVVTRSVLWHVLWHPGDCEDDFRECLVEKPLIEANGKSEWVILES